MFARATLRQRVQVLAVALAMLLLITGIVGPLTVRERDAAARDLRVRIEPLRQSVNELRLAMLDQESAVRGYLLTGDEASLEPYFDAQRIAHEELLRLESLSADDPEFNQQVRSTGTTVDRWQTEVGDHQVELVEDGEVERAVAFERSGAGSSIADDVRTQILGLRAALIAEARAADDRVAEAATRFTVLLWTLAGLGAGFVAVTAFLLRRWVTAPLGQITSAVEAVTRGDRYRQIPTVGPPDLAGLAANVEAMRAETVRRLDEAVRARKALEQQGPAVVTLRAELAPQERRLPDNVAFASAFEPAEGELAGDWYDVVDLGEGRVGLLMVDVSGHGPDAGVFALRAKHLLAAVMRERPSPGEAFGWLAERIGDTGERFLTGVVIEVDSHSGAVRYANAGHPPALLVAGSADGGCLRRLEPTGPLLGPLPGHWATAEERLTRGVRLVAYTDGLVEARDASGSPFGDERLADLLKRTQGTPAETAAACVQRVRAFSNGHIGDDLTVAVLELERNQ